MQCLSFASMIDIVLPLAILAILCFLVYRIPYHLSSKSSGYLPTTRYHLSRPIPTPQGWTVDWTGGQLSLSTRDYNAVPRLLLGGWKGYQPLLSRFYALGGLAGILGLIVSLGGAAWAVIQVWGTVWEEFAAHSETMASSTLAKRSFADVGASSIIAKRSVLPGIQGGLSDTGTFSMHSTGLSPLVSRLCRACCRVEANMSRYPASQSHSRTCLRSSWFSYFVNLSMSSGTLFRRPCKRLLADHARMQLTSCKETACRRQSSASTSTMRYRV